MNEVWKDIIGYEGLYQISNLGQVKRDGRILKQNLDGRGYLGLALSKNGKAKTNRIHKLVAWHFVGGFNEGLQVNHIDGNKQNNKSTNLEWVTHKENAIHAVNTGLTKLKKRGQHSRFKGAIQLSSDGFGYIAFGRYDIKNLGFNPSSVYMCLSGIRKKCKGYKVDRIQQAEKMK